jgi:hypothetical protein
MVPISMMVLISMLTHPSPTFIYNQDPINHQGSGGLAAASFLKSDSIGRRPMRKRSKSQALKTAKPYTLNSSEQAAIVCVTNSSLRFCDKHSALGSSLDKHCIHLELLGLVLSGTASALRGTQHLPPCLVSVTLCQAIRISPALL